MNRKEELMRLAIKCNQISSALEDYEFLAGLHSEVVPTRSSVDFDKDSFQQMHGNQKTLIKNLSSICKECGNIWTVNETLDWLTFYLFVRCFGWDDLNMNDPRFQILMPSTQQRSRKAYKDDELRFKDRIITVSEDLVDWFYKSTLTLVVLKSFVSAIRLARGMLNTRLKLMTHSLRWLTFSLQSSGLVNGRPLSIYHPSDDGYNKPVHRPSFYPTPHPYLPEDATPETMFMAVKDLILVCATDSSQLVRQAISTPLSRLFVQLSNNTLNRLVDSLLEAHEQHVQRSSRKNQVEIPKKRINFVYDECVILEKSDFGSSDAIEGLLRVLGLLIKRLFSYSSNPILLNSPAEPRKSVFINDQTLLRNTQLPTILFPDYFQQQLLPKIQLIVFKLFSHTEEFVRKAATKFYLSCLHRCPPKVMEEALCEAADELFLGPENHTKGDLKRSSLLGWVPTPAMAECLLALCQNLLKKVGESNLPHNTGVLQNHLVDTYLNHPSANVRKNACAVYLTLFLSALDNPNRIRYLLSKVLENWQVRQDIVLTPINKLQSSGLRPSNNFTIDAEKMNRRRESTFRDPARSTRSDGAYLPWTWRDGRLRIYRSVSHLLVERHIKMLNEINCSNILRESIPEDAATVTFDLNTDRRSTAISNIRQRSRTIAPSEFSQQKSVQESKRPNSLAWEDANQMKRTSISPMFSPSESIFSPSHPVQSFQKLLSRKSTTKENLTILEKFRMMDEAEKAKQLESSKAGAWLATLTKRFSISSTHASLSSVSARPESDFMNIRTMFSNMLHISVECMIDENVELNKLSKPTFISVEKLIRCYDPNLMLDLITTHLVYNPTMMTYAALKMLRNSLDELCQYDNLIQNQENEQINSISDNGTSSSPILNCEILFNLFSQEKSTLWLRSLQHYVTERTTHVFISLTALDCILRTLYLVNRLPQLTSAAIVSDSQRPCSFKPKLSNNQTVNVDLPALSDALKAMITFTQRFEVILNENNEPYTQSMDHIKIKHIIPTPSLLQPTDSNRRSSDAESMFPAFIAKLIAKLESVLFTYLPPNPQLFKPDPITRRAAGLILSPLLPQLPTWPLALLPFGCESTAGSFRKEDRILAVRRLLRLTASVVFALPIGSNSKEMDDTLKDDRESMVKLESISSSRIDLTTVVNLYFAQLENICKQLVRSLNDMEDAYKSASLCSTCSWWWFRALCEHLPRLMQVAPNANPASIIHCVAEQANKLSGNNKKIKINLLVKKRSALWTRAIELGLKEARRRLNEKNKNTFAYRWPTVGEILRTKTTIKKSSFDDPNDKHQVLSKHVSQSGLNNRNNSATDFNLDEVYSDDGDYDMADSSSDGDFQDEILVSKHREKRRNIFSVPLKAEPIETPPAFQDVMDLIERTLPFCQQVTISTLRQLHSGEDSMFTKEITQKLRQRRQTVLN